MGLFKSKVSQSLPEFETELGVLYAITNDTMIDLSTVSDEVFSQKMLGDGVAFESKDGIIYSPCDGAMSVVFETGHAFGIVTKDGAELLIHIGFDTVRENGNGFTTYVQSGDQVRAGQIIATFDKKYLSQKGYELAIPLIFSNMDSVESLQCETYGKVSAGDRVLRYRMK
jgi:glucose-specific phosphotransferase system IIA component